MIAQIFYTSVSTYTRADISDLNILRSALRNNPKMGLTGFLFRTNKHFMQFIEGEEAALDAVMEKIRGDDRHTKLKEWPMELASERTFPDWAMGYGETLGDESFAQTAHYAANQVSFDQMRFHISALAAPFYDDQSRIQNRL